MKARNINVSNLAEGSGLAGESPDTKTMSPQLQTTHVPKNQIMAYFSWNETNRGNENHKTNKATTA